MDIDLPKLNSLVSYLVLIASAHLIKAVIDLFFHFQQKKIAIHDETIKSLTLEVAKTNRSVNRCFYAIRLLAEDKWENIKENISDDFEN